MKVGDLVRYGYERYSDEGPVFGVVLSVNETGGTLKVLDKFGKIDWFVTSYCEIVKKAQ